MSTIANWAYTRPLTLWAAAFDEYGQPTYTRMYELLGAYKLEQALRPDAAVPTSEASSGGDVFYFEYLGDDPPLVGWKIALGEFPGAPPEGAKVIETVTIYDVAMFGETVPDYTVVAR
jgi:hypothetical protein